MILVLLLSILLVIVLLIRRYFSARKKVEPPRLLPSISAPRSVEDIQNEIEEELSDEPDIDVEEVLEELKTCSILPVGGLCGVNYKLDDNGCCELKEAARRSQAGVNAADIAKTIITEYTIGEIFELAVKKGYLRAKRTAVAKTFAKGAKTIGNKIVGKALKSAALRLSKSLTKASNPALMAAEITLAVLDIIDVDGYSTFISQGEFENLRRVLDYGYQKALEDSGLLYPATYPIADVFPEEYEAAYTIMASEFQNDALNNIIEKYPNIFVEALGGDEDASEIFSEKIGDEIEELSGKNYRKRDRIIYDEMRELLPTSKRSWLKNYTFVSDEKRTGVTLSRYGADQWNTMNRDKFMSGDENAPMVAIYTNTYRVLNRSRPGTAENPNVIEKRLKSSTVLAFPYQKIWQRCESGGKPGIAGTTVNPYKYGVRFNEETGLCNYTSSYCSRMGLQKSGNNCKQRAGQDIAEIIFGETLTRGTIRFFTGELF